MKKKIMALIIAASVITVSGCGKTETPVEVQTSDSGTTSTEAVTADTDNSPISSAEGNNEQTSEPPVVQTEEAETDLTDFEYFEENGEITITGYIGESTAVVFPAAIDGKPVTKIGYIGSNGEWSNVIDKNVESAVIPEGVTTIEAGAFYNAAGLVDLIIPESVTNFGHNDNGLTPFSNSLWLENKREEDPLVIVNNIVIDGQKCTRSVDIPDGVTEILDSAFYYCTTITDVSLPKSLEKIDSRAFYGCSRLNSVDIPDNVRSIGDNAFNGCTAITDVSLPKSLEEIGGYAFFECSGLNSVVIPDSVRSIGEYAFNSCKALEDVTFPNNIVEMGGYIFNATPWLDNKREEDPLVIVNGNLIDAQWCKGNVVVPDSVKSIAEYAFSQPGWSAITSVELPDGIKKVPDYLFWGSYSLENVVIPDSVTEIGSFAFSKCALKSIKIPESVTEIGSYAFSWCYFESVIIPNSVEIIGDEAFYYCQNLVSATLSDNLTSLGLDAFSYTKCDITYKGEIYFPELYGELYEAVNGKAE